MMKKGMIKFLATGMTALTLMGATVAFAPATQVFAAEAETMADASQSTRELKTMSVKQADVYVKELVGNAAPYKEYENTKMYRVGNHVYSISTFEQEPEIINQKFNIYREAKKFYCECLDRGMDDGDIEEYYYEGFEGERIFAYAKVVGIIPTVNLSIGTYTIKPVETVKITANKTTIHPGDYACLQFHVNDGADESAVTWRAVGTEGIADFCVVGNEAFVTGFETGTVMVVAETEDGVRDYIHIDICDF